MNNISKNKINVSFFIENKKEYDLYIILSDDISYIQKYEKCIKNKNKIVIITQNKNIDHIIRCVNITKNMYYLYSSDEYLLNKFDKIYESNLAKYN